MKRIGKLLLILLPLILAGCQQAAEKRIRAAFDIGPDVKITEEVISANVLKQVPLGTKKEVVLKRLRELEEGPLVGMSDSIVGVYPIDGENRVVFRFEYGNSMRLVKEHYAVEFSFSDEDLLKEVVPHVWLTGL